MGLARVQILVYTHKVNLLKKSSHRDKTKQHAHHKKKMRIKRKLSSVAKECKQISSHSEVHQLNMLVIFLAACSLS